MKKDFALGGFTMPGRRENTEKVRQRIIKEAATLFRRHGYDGVNIDQIMAAANLTRGGFYYHFKSKEALFAEVMRYNHGLLVWFAKLDAPDGPGRMSDIKAMLARYLEPSMLAEVGANCSLAALNGDASRLGPAVRDAFTDSVQELAKEIARGTVDGDPHRKDVLATLAMSIGGLMLARTVNDAHLAEDILRACQDSLDTLLPGHAENESGGGKPELRVAN